MKRKKNISIFPGWFSLLYTYLLLTVQESNSKRKNKKKKGKNWKVFKTSSLEFSNFLTNFLSKYFVLIRYYYKISRICNY